MNTWALQKHRHWPTKSQAGWFGAGQKATRPTRSMRDAKRLNPFGENLRVQDAERPWQIEHLPYDRDLPIQTAATAKLSPELEVSLLTGCEDRHYAVGLSTALLQAGVSLDVIGSDVVDSPEMHGNRKLRFLNFRGSQDGKANLCRKISRVLAYYARLLHYAAVSKPRIVHILWNNKFEFFDRTVLMLYYKLLRKKLVLTAHNVNAGRRDSKDSLLNRLTLRIQYRLCDHIFVHTEQMKQELVEAFHIPNAAISVIPYGINDAIPTTDLGPQEAKRRLGIATCDRVILFFGAIAPYKGLDLLTAAFERLTADNPNYLLVIAGKPKPGCDRYLAEVQTIIRRSVASNRVIQRIEYIPDDETELYFKAADVLVLPYRTIFQSGVLFLALSFGLPVVAADVGSFREDVIEGRTGFLCKPNDDADLSEVLEKYFRSELFAELEQRRSEIRSLTAVGHSWETVGRLTRSAYLKTLNGSVPDSMSPRD